MTRLRVGTMVRCMAVASPSTLFAQVPPEVSVYEVGLRDGLQNERAHVPLPDKLRLLDALVAAGLRRLELTSCVAQVDPQLADADDVAAHAVVPPGVQLSALCPNARGLERALAAKVPEVAVFLSASETHNRKNVNKTIAETIQAFEAVVGPARAAGLRVRGYVSTVWGCPYEGPVAPEAVVRLTKRLVDLGCQVSLGDTVGYSTPARRPTLARARRGADGRRRDAHARHAARPSRTCSWGQIRHPHVRRRSAAWAAAPTRPAPRATSRRRTSSARGHGRADGRRPAALVDAAGGRGLVGQRFRARSTRPS